MQIKTISLAALITLSAGASAQGIEEYPSMMFSASFTRDFRVQSLSAGASMAARVGETSLHASVVQPVPMLMTEWTTEAKSNALKISLMGVPINSNHRLDETGEGGSNWEWWALGGVAAAAVAVIAVSAGGGNDNHSQTSGNAPCQTSTGIGPIGYQNC